MHGYDDYTWNKSLETGTFDPTFFRGTGKIVDLVANDVKRRLCAGTMVNGDTSQAAPEGAPPPYEYSEILPVRCEAGSSNLAASTQISGGGKSTKGDVLPPKAEKLLLFLFNPIIMITWQSVVSLTSQLAGQGAGPLRREGYCVGAAEEAAIYLIDDGS